MRRFRFRLRKLFFLIGVLCVPLGWYGYECQKWRDEQSALRRLHRVGVVSYYSMPVSGYTGSGLPPPKAQAPDESWFRNLREKLSLERVVDLEIYPSRVSEKQIEVLRQSPRTEHASVDKIHALSQAGITRVGSTKRIAFGSAEAALLPNLSALCRLSLSYTQISDDDLVYVGRLHSLTYLDLQGTPITDEGLQHLTDLAELRELHVSYTGISDAGFAHLRALANLEKLTAWGNDSIGDAGLVHLAALKGLKYVNVSETAVTLGAIEELRAALPDCDIRSKPNSERQ